MLELIEEVKRFRDDRNWKRFHNAKDLALSLNLEASELLENFQWIGSKEAVEKNFDNIQDELADVLIYSILFADELNLNLEEIIRKKLAKNEEKYPINKAYDSNEKYNKLK
ncbi:nucleotide pyrophosphohydrolase [Paraliobacillus quinghaiensis]|uniref:Nucleotide pyrophosphohydrolase n=1 Tax=Paraliobacillus quinghaiensis TaxID=470815 RepID=A0A917TX42_9BACI|nr:nucleotide pyrophosphohydrolase [Paraliobacillus quinghaiensis]GGM40476.1 nucleotide pyrophosphohydrolase [Paraliobacillus quinghaiensis]